MSWKKFGSVSINLETVPTSKKEFSKLYKGKIPNVDEAWNEIKKKATD